MLKNEAGTHLEYFEISVNFALFSYQVFILRVSVYRNIFAYLERTISEIIAL